MFLLKEKNCHEYKNKNYAIRLKTFLKIKKKIKEQLYQSPVSITAPHFLHGIGRIFFSICYQTKQNPERLW